MARDRNGPAIDFQLLVYPVTDGATFDTDSYRDNAEGYLLTTEDMYWFWDLLRRPFGALEPLRLAGAC